MYDACPQSTDTKVLNMYNIFNLQKRLSMNCLYITLFFNIVDGIVQTIIKSWNQLLYPRVIEVYRQPFEPGHDFSSSNFFPVRCFFRWRSKWKSPSATSDCTADGPIYPFSLFALRNHMSVGNSHLAGLWIGAAISNTSHSNKASSTTVKRSRLTGKGSRSTAVLP